MTEIDYDSAVAIVGMSGRFPGASDIDELWANLMAGRPGLREVSEEALAEAGVSPALLADPDYVRTAAPLDDIDMFDAAMFGFSRHEAEMMDPQHRVLLECCWAALESSGYPPSAMPGRVGLFAGSGYPDYLLHVGARLMTEPGGALQMAVGNERDSLSSLVSYKLDLRGPSVTVQTFCSTSLVAVHLATQSLLNFECEVALAGGVFIPLPQGVGYRYEDGGIYAPDGQVRAFDADARGSVVGSGVAVVVVKRLADALDDGDNIEALILGSAVNNDGRACAGYTAPGVDGQAEVMRQALSFAGVPPETVGYVECHGTGTMLGDSIELAALARAFPNGAGRPIVLGSLKPSIGHLDRASGTTGLIRAALALRRRVLPATPNFQSPNPALAGMSDRFTVLTEHQPWPEGPQPRRAGVSSFGLGGTNAHIVLEEPPHRPVPPDHPGPHLLVLSARDGSALEEATQDLARHLDAHPDLRPADVAFTLQQSRTRFPVRRAVVCADLDDAHDAAADRRRWRDAETRHRDPVVDLDLADPDAVPETWWRELRSALHDLVAAAAPPRDGGTPRDTALVELAAGLARLGCRIGRVAGDGGSAEPAEPVAGGPVDATGELRTRILVEPAAGEGARHWLLSAVARLWLAGVDVRWSQLRHGDARRVPLPTYPFQRRRYWVDLPHTPFALPDPPESGRTDDLARWTYAPAWRHRPLEIADRAEQIRAGGPWLVLAADDLGEAVLARLRGAGAEVVAARPGPGFTAGEAGWFTVRPDDAADIGRLIGSLATPPRTVVHALAVGSHSPDEARVRGVQSLLALAGTLAEHAPAQRVDLLALTEEAVSVAGSVPRQPEHAAFAGLVPVLAQENPGWRCRHVDIARNPGSGPTALARAIVDEAVTGHEGPVALRGTGRWVRGYEHRPLPPPPPDGPLGPGATVLITGGLGHVGLILARHLTLRRGCRVVLTARTALPDRERWRALLAQPADLPPRLVRVLETLVELEDAGGQVLVVAADVSDERGMRAAVRTAVERFGGLNLVVHGAGVSDPAAFGPAHLLDRQAVRAHFAAKVDGFGVLRRVLAGRECLGITLSSLSAVLGGLALGPYAAANAALDACAVAARAAGQGRWLTVDWDTWRPHEGIEDNPAHNDAFDMAHDEAVEVFDRAVTAIDQVDHLVISTGPLDARVDQWVLGPGQDTAADTDDGVRDPRPDLSTPYVEPAEGMQRLLADIWAQVLRLDKVGVDDDFFRLGGTSVVAIELIAKVRRELGLPVPVSAMLGFPTVRGLAAQIAP